MIARKSGGSIILTASMAGHIVNYPQVHVAYGSSKAAVQHMTRCLAAEWAEHGIRVNSLSPGYMDTRLNASEDLEDAVPIWLDRTPFGRMGRPEELIGPVVFLASSAASFMTGADLRIDGQLVILFSRTNILNGYRWIHSLLMLIVFTAAKVYSDEITLIRVY